MPRPGPTCRRWSAQLTFCRFRVRFSARGLGKFCRRARTGGSFTSNWTDAENKRKRVAVIAGWTARFVITKPGGALASCAPELRARRWNTHRFVPPAHPSPAHALCCSSGPRFRCRKAFLLLTPARVFRNEDAYGSPFASKPPACPRSLLFSITIIQIISFHHSAMAMA